MTQNLLSGNKNENFRLVSEKNRGILRRKRSASFLVSNGLVGDGLPLIPSVFQGGLREPPTFAPKTLNPLPELVG